MLAGPEAVSDVLTSLLEVLKLGKPTMLVSRLVVRAETLLIVRVSLLRIAGIVVDDTEPGVVVVVEALLIGASDNGAEYVGTTEGVLVLTIMLLDIVMNTRLARSRTVFLPGVGVPPVGPRLVSNVHVPFA